MPVGTSSERVFASRHRLLLVLAWAQIPVLAAFGLALGATLETTGLVALALILLTTSATLTRRHLLAACLVAVVLVADSIALITFADGAPITHLHLLFTVVAVSLYRDWRPLALAIMSIATYHLIAGLGVDGPGLAWIGLNIGFAVLIALAGAAGWRAPSDDGLPPSVDQFRLAFDAAPIGMAMLRPSGEFIQVNAAMAEILEMEISQFPGSNVRVIVNGDDMAELGAAWETMGNHDEHVAATWVRCNTAGGRSIWARISLSLVPWSPGRPAMVVLQMEDATNHHVEQRRLERLITGKDEFVAAVGSEMSRQLSLVTDLADRREPDVARIRGQVREVESIVDDLVESARAGAGQTTVVSLPVDVVTLCEDVVAAVPDSSGVNVTATEATIWADPALTRQILFGLVNNAVRFGGPNVSVTVSRSGPDISIAVLDDGPALPDAQIERMFTSDLRHGQPVTRPATVGLSLTVGRHLARRMEGDVVYRRTSEGENLYELRLPSERVDRMFESADEVDISV